MKTKIAFPFRPALMIAAMAFSFTMTGCSKEETTVATPGATPSLKESTLNYSQPVSDETLSLPASVTGQELSEQEREALIHMRSEELVAHDVYLAFSNQYPNPIFRNITKSENAHAGAILTLLTRYGIPDPEAGHVAGQYSDPNFQELYNTLTAAGNVSLFNAMTVGATIEDLDIFDLQNYLLVVDNTDITFVFKNLTGASKNHMRAFYANIVALGGTYTPQYITQAEFEAIIHP